MDVTLHLFPNIAATELSVRHLRDISDRGWKYERDQVPRSWKGLYVAITDLIPVLYARQGRDAAAYAFICHRDEELPWFTMPSGFESLQMRTSLGHQVLMTLMAIKALRYLQDIENISMAFRGIIPQEIIDNICEFPGTDFLGPISGFDFIKATGDASWRHKKIRETRRIVRLCVFNAGSTNRHIWTSMLDTERLAARDIFGQFNVWTDGRRETAEMVATRQYQLWMETPGSYDILRSAMAATARWSSARGFCWPIQRQTRVYASSLCTKMEAMTVL